MASEPYKKLEEDAMGASPLPRQAVDMENIRSFLTNAVTDRKNGRLKMYNAMVLLSFAESALALLILLLGVTCNVLKDTGNGYGGSGSESCVFGTAVWVGVLSLIAGALGVIALRIPEGRKGYMVAYLVLCIFACVADSVLMVFSSIWVSVNVWHSSYHHAYNLTVAAISLNTVLLLGAFCHMVISIISTAFICYNWNCCDKKPGVVIFYVPHTVAANSAQGENVTFLPTTENGNIAAIQKNSVII